MNQRLTAYRKILIGCTGVVLCILFLYLYLDAMNRVPEKIHLLSDKEQVLNFSVPVTGELYEELEETGDFGETNIPEDKIHMNLQQETMVHSGQTGAYKMDCRLFGVIPIKTVEVSVMEDTTLIPAGIPIGIYVRTNGVLIIGTGEVQGMDGLKTEPCKYLLQSGDYIEEVNDMRVEDKTELIHALNQVGDGQVIFKIRRGEERFLVKLDSVETAPGEYKLGIWVRDNTQGIGTLTFLKENGDFGALGHGVNDIDTAGLMEVYGGTLYDTKILSITKGKSGTPGELSGVIDYKEANVLGDITINSNGGIFGRGNERLINRVQGKALPIGLKQEIEKGEATILCTLDDETKEYKIRIDEVDYTPSSVNKGIVFYVTDEELLERTGGIVQGLSGSPIIQNGKLVGAVTHVFVQDPTKGFGIFIENMLAR